ncbi:hypothetical protein CKO22_08125 [Thiococcus pfennigii]|nr:hypothetical protein [Thiococcus pfennigii]
MCDLRLEEAAARAPGQAQVDAVAAAALGALGEPDVGEARLPAGRLGAPAQRPAQALDRCRGCVRGQFAQVEAGLDRGQGARVPGACAPQVEAPRLLAENADIATLSQLTLRLPTAGGPEIALRTHFRNAEVAAIPRYLPVGIMNPRLVRWLDRALPRGRVPAGDLLVLGPLAAFPFGQGEGRFEVLFDVEDVELSYNQDWPSIVQADGRLRFLNRRLDIELSDARTLDTALGPVHAAIPDLIDAERVLIRGAGRGPFADGLRLIEASPLAERLGTLGEAFAATGPMHLDLDLAYPLDDEAPIALRGEVTWPTPDAGLAVVGTDIALAGLGGQLVVTADGVATERLTGQIWDQPVTLRIHPTGPDEEATRVEVEGTTPIAELARRLPSGPWSLAAGRLPWHLDLTFEHQDLEAHSPPLDWELTSDLAGVRLDLPAPFGKDAATIRRLRLTGKSAPSDARLTIDATLGALAARLDLAEGDGARLTRGSVGVGRPAPALPDGPGLVVAGQLDALDVPAWLAWAQRHDLATGPGGPLPLRRLDLRIARLDLGPATSHDLELHAERHPGRWQARIDTAELAGALTLPDQTRATPMEIRLEHLDLAELLVRQDDAEPPRPRPPGRARLSDPRTARPFTLEVARLLWRGESLGQAEVRSFTVPSGLVFDRLSIGGPPATLFGSGEWVVGDDGLPRTELTLRGSGADLGRILHTVGYGSVLDAAPTTAHLDLGWPGSTASRRPAPISTLRRPAMVATRISSGSSGSSTSAPCSAVSPSTSAISTARASASSASTANWRSAAARRASIASGSPGPPATSTSRAVPT